MPDCREPDENNHHIVIAQPGSVILVYKECNAGIKPISVLQMFLALTA